MTFSLEHKKIECPCGSRMTAGLATQVLQNDDPTFRPRSVLRTHAAGGRGMDFLTGQCLTQLEVGLRIAATGTFSCIIAQPTYPTATTGGLEILSSYSNANRLPFVT